MEGPPPMIDRRTLMALSAAALARPTFATEHEGEPFTPQTVIDLARSLSGRDREEPAKVPQEWLDLDYDQYRSIWFRHDRALWQDTESPYRVDFFAPGLYFPTPVRIDLVEDGMARQHPFTLSDFDRSDQFPDLGPDPSLGFSGFRLRTGLETPDIFQEFCVFQGASYLRAIGRGQVYGLSARGLALGTGSPGGEEFPEFRRFWLESPAPGDTRITVHALLDSPSVAGAYTFVIDPGDSTVMDVTATLFPRVELERVGIAPMTSMFLFDATNRNRFDDFRPAVHDSDGLSMWNGAGERLWRPLANPSTLQISSFSDNGPKGFGLMQRSRAVGDFSDFEADYHRRPSLWIEPLENWGQGAVELVEIPADREIYDNIVAAWRPRTALQPGQRHNIAYRLHWTDAAPNPGDVAQVTETRQGLGFEQTDRVFAIDFAAHPALDGDLDALTPFVGASEGSLTGPRLERHPGTGGVRLSFAFDPAEGTAREFRAQILRDGTPVTEVWLYRWTT
ncbi:Glucans biosynthesis protein G precursor [Rhodobacteraceae bacterium THAF1]|nr:Glucans biosynthesis protein G precursor [Palleronia sp. THAF1]VDC17105.1 Glucans biosynthesis protein G precursor [Rhodobacteraceae bacterium THAF1]